MNNGYIYYGFLKYNKNYQNDTWEYVYSNIDLSNCLDTDNLFYLPLVSRTGKVLYTKKIIVTYLALVPTFPSNNLKLGASNYIYKNTPEQCKNECEKHPKHDCVASGGQGPLEWNETLCIVQHCWCPNIRPTPAPTQPPPTPAPCNGRPEKLCYRNLFDIAGPSGESPDIFSNCVWDDSLSKCCDYKLNQKDSPCAPTPKLHPLIGNFIGNGGCCRIPATGPDSNIENTRGYFTALATSPYIMSEDNLPIRNARSDRGASMWNYMNANKNRKNKKIDWFILGGAADHAPPWNAEKEIAIYKKTNLVTELKNAGVEGIILDVEHFFEDNNKNDDFTKIMKYFHDNDIVTAFCTMGNGPEEVQTTNKVYISDELLSYIDYWIPMWYAQGKDTYSPEEIYGFLDGIDNGLSRMNFENTRMKPTELLKDKLVFGAADDYSKVIQTHKKIIDDKFNGSIIIWCTRCPSVSYPNGCGT